MLIGFDCDDVLIPLVDGEWLKRYNGRYNDNVTKKQILSWDIYKYMPKATKQQVYDILDEPDLYNDIVATGVYYAEFVNGVTSRLCSELKIPSLDIINKLRSEGHRILFITSCTKKSAGRKLEWLQKWGYVEKESYCLDYIECTDKTLINVDVMIDDRFETIEKFAKLEKLAILFTQPWNEGCAWINSPNIKRANNFTEVYDTIKKHEGRIVVDQTNKLDSTKITPYSGVISEKTEENTKYIEEMNEIKYIPKSVITEQTVFGFPVASIKDDKKREELNNTINSIHEEQKWNYDLNKGGVKQDQGKTRWSLLSYPALNEIAKVMTKNVEKYSAYNWAKGLHYSRVYDATMRHLSSWFSGEDNDLESGLSHLAHAGCCIMFLLSYQLWNMTEFDDRYIRKLENK